MENDQEVNEHVNAVLANVKKLRQNPDTCPCYHKFQYKFKVTDPDRLISAVKTQVEKMSLKCEQKENVLIVQWM